jgi:hypothetical protein
VQTANIFLKSVNKFMFVIMTGCVLFDVRTGFLNTALTIFGFNGLVSEQLFIRMQQITLFRSECFHNAALEISGRFNAF